MADIDIESLVHQFQALQVDNRQFGHLEHVAVAFGMLQQVEFFEAASRIASTLRRMTDAVGAPE